VDIAEVRTAEGKIYLFVAIDRVSKFAYVELMETQGKKEAAQFLKNLIALGSGLISSNKKGKYRRCKW
jgi:transposase-like protein